MKRRRIHPEPLVYRITSRAGVDGVTLAKDGHWGGLWFVDTVAATGAAKDDAKGRPHRIEVKAMARTLA